MQRLLVALLLLFPLAIVPAWSQTKTGLACELPTELTTPSASLSNVARAISKGSLDILALGSGSTVGTGERVSPRLPNADISFPYRMANALRSARPDLKVGLTVKGGRSMTADVMLPILRAELAAHHYDLVLWQTGTVEAVHGVRPDVLAGTLQDGADAVNYAHADLVLVDPQFSRFLRANVDLSPYETVLEQMTNSQSVTLFHRFELTKGWVNDGQLDLERVSREQRDITIASLNDCLGQALARYVLTGAGAH